MYSDHMAVIGLGSNVGDRLMHLSQARWDLATKGVLLQSSSVYETSPWGYSEQGPFLHAVVSIQTRLTPQELLQFMQEVEARAKRNKTILNGPRSLDLDLLLFDDLICTEQSLILPHARMTERDFVLSPLCEILPDLIHPQLKLSIKDLCNQVEMHTLTGNVFAWDGSSINPVV